MDLMYQKQIQMVMMLMLHLNFLLSKLFNLEILLKTLLTHEMEALEEDYGDGNGKNESRKFMEGLMDLALNRESIDWRQ